MDDTKISALTAVTTPAGTDEFAVNQGGASKKETLAQIRASLPTLPTIASVGAEFTSTGVPTATLPGTHAADDILILIIQTANDSVYAAPTGYTRLGPSNGIGAAAVAGATKLSIFWKRDGGSESAPTLTDAGDHTYGVMIAVRGCPTTTDPMLLLGQAFKFVASTAGTTDRGSTVIGNCLVMAIFAHAIDTAGAQGSSPTNAGLTSVTEQFDGSTADGTGGGIYVMTGVKATHGSFVPCSVTWAASTVDVSTLLAFQPADSAEHSRPTQIQTFIGSPTDLDDTWVRPDNAVSVRVQTLDGGGSGSGGNIATTAAGGGGGGGGGYNEAFFPADMLTATCRVHAGKGGAAGTALNQAGNIGVLSSFDQGTSVGPVATGRRIAGIAATAAASADGGNGGSGSGSGAVSPAVATTRLSMEVTTDGVAYGSVGGRGGSGTTAMTGGSPADWGGGGGESGADTDAGTSGGNNGYSIKGAGGGSSGRTNTNISVPGAGGGSTPTAAAQGATGDQSIYFPYGAAGGYGGGSTVVTGGTGGFPGGGGGGGAGVAGGFGGAGGHGCVVVTTYF